MPATGRGRNRPPTRSTRASSTSPGGATRSSLRRFLRDQRTRDRGGLWCAPVLIPRTCCRGEQGDRPKRSLVDEDMSHYIVATDGRESIELSPGLSATTLHALCCSGLDLYGLYRARECDGGVSGTQESREIDAGTAKSALIEALSWAYGLEAADPGAFHGMWDVSVDQMAGLSAAEWSEEDRARVFRGARKMRSDLEDASLDEAEFLRALQCVESILTFSATVYQKARRGRVRIDFM